MKYEPKPIDTSKIKLPPYLEEIIEKLSLSVHDNWAQKRISAGWKYGPKRDDTLREHPCLVPYAELPEEEKDYDRKTLTESIKMLLAFGCSINTPASGGAAYAELLTVDSFRQLGQSLRRRGDSLQAYDAIETGLSCWPQDTRLLQLKSLVLADLGVLKPARDILIQLVKEGHTDEETLGILARTYKEEWLQSCDPKNVKKYLSLAFETYRKCFINTGGYYPGINTATLATLLGKSKTAKKIASLVGKECLEKLADPQERNNGEYYLTATLAEAYLILEEYDKAQEYYVLTGILGKGMPQDLQATRKNARFLIKYLGIDGSSIENALQLPGVAVFISDTFVEDIPGEGANIVNNHKYIEYIVKRIFNILDKRKIGIGYSSAKAGPDLCFLNALREKGCEAYIALPFNKAKFLLECIGIAGRMGWEKLFDDIFNVFMTKRRLRCASEWP
ncbi:MAG: Guanylate cyclase protein, partial [Thermodesulfobacteriota bacterium]|nr:Guanylate cyclase protein [Thermodesulfobacteriota bacterium]